METMTNTMIPTPVGELLLPGIFAERMDLAKVHLEERKISGEEDE
jgi:hypothetical protein